MSTRGTGTAIIPPVMRDRAGCRADRCALKQTKQEAPAIEVDSMRPFRTLAQVGSPPGTVVVPWNIDVTKLESESMVSECKELDTHRSEISGDRRVRTEIAIVPKPGREGSIPSSTVQDAPLTGRVQKRTVTLEANDGYRLAATHFRLPVPPRANLVVAPAIGVPQGFYSRFARFCAAAGYETLTLDYRGIGQSAPGNLKGVEISCLDWGRRDLAAAVTAMRDPSRPLYLVAHSFGGHAYGLLPDPSAVSAMYSFGTGAGWHGWMPRAERVKVLAMWHVLGPILTRWNGYLSWSRLGMGEDLPLGVYREWKRWCGYPNYFFGDPKLTCLKDQFAAIRTPIAAAASIDDRWAPPRSRDALMAGYVNAPIVRFDIDPARMGLPPLGHMGYFRSEAQPLWQAALDWLAARGCDSLGRGNASSASVCITLKPEPRQAC